MIGILLRLFYNAFVLPVLLLFWAAGPGRRLRRAHPLKLRLGQVPDAAPRARFWPQTSPLERLAGLLDAAAANPRVSGLLLVLDGVSGNACQLSELRPLVERFKRSGKPLHVHLDHADWPALAALAPADRISLPPTGNVLLHGTGVELVFFGELLDRHGVALEVVQRGEYKGVMEPFVRREPSAALAESLTALVDSFHDELGGRLAGRPGWDLPRARAALEDGPYTAQRTLEVGLLDGTGQLDEAEDVLRTAAGARSPEPGRDRPLRPDPGRGARPRPAAPPLLDAAGAGLIRPRPAALRRPPLIAFIPISGLIVDTPVAGLGRRQVAVAAAIAPRILALADNPRVAAIVLVIDSRGGTVSGSDRIWDAARHGMGRKPVVAWMRSYAASGGYYVAAAAQYIVASPFTITGSIGVIASKPNLSVAAGRLGVNAVTLARGRGAHPFSPLRPFDEPTRAWMDERIDELYRRFTTIVAEGRRLPAEAVEAVARGRVWSGPQAQARDLVDRIGHYEEVVSVARELANLRADSGRVVWVTPPEGLVGRLRRVAGATGPAGELALDPALEPVILSQQSRFLYYCPPLAWT